MGVRQYYDAYWTADYRRPAILPEIEQVLEAVVDRDSRCLDVGCGDGARCGVWLHDHARSYTGVDIAATAVKKARSRGLDARLVEDASRLPFDEGSFDVVVIVEVLEHLFDPEAAASEAFRVLQPGGFLLATAPNIAYWRERLTMLRGRWNPGGDGGNSVIRPWGDPHLRFFTLDSLGQMLLGAGFKQVRVTGQLGRFSGDLPGLRRLSGQRGASALYRALERRRPALLGQVLFATASR